MAKRRAQIYSIEFENIQDIPGSIFLVGSQDFEKFQQPLQQTLCINNYLSKSEEPIATTSTCSFKEISDGVQTVSIYQAVKFDPETGNIHYFEIPSNIDPETQNVFLYFTNLGPETESLVSVLNPFWQQFSKLKLATTLKCTDEIGVSTSISSIRSDPPKQVKSTKEWFATFKQILKSQQVNSEDAYKNFYLKSLKKEKKWSQAAFQTTYDQN